ncbi:imidazole glycerol phosphate synthase subunit HisH [Fusibacter ferrireducens]|uniref:Imidazole glycerol phosphate synthase subunit HisH n=1 Tax=Fusibacter ferrireducens TaxID=2785058 RepID=A0ABR9ZUL5_9FIRM|nr:imidazole glycerol phosphate synthase subunit HisH [Fusibacter ferrireducens]MBF4694152.1 imidazole glycerol phosphate synthase subunit HisH [Fusibacter ferrireducens]
MTIIIDYGVGNIFNVLNAFSKIDPDTKLSADPKEILAASHIILPGVGAFEDAMKALEALGLDETIKTAANMNIPILGICLGMQLLYEKSLENGEWQGLGLLPGTIDIFNRDAVTTIPHMGWNDLIFTDQSPFVNISGFAYFVHSYLAPPDAQYVYAYVTYEKSKVPAIVGTGNVYGMQFHPEKSSATGAKLIQQFYELTQEAL